MFGAPTPAALAVAHIRRASRPPPPRSRALRRRCGPTAARASNGCADLAPAWAGCSTCACSRVTLADGTSAVLIAALERAGPIFSISAARRAAARRLRRAGRGVRRRRRADRRDAGGAPADRRQHVAGRARRRTRSPRSRRRAISAAAMRTAGRCVANACAATRVTVPRRGAGNTVSRRGALRPPTPRLTRPQPPAEPPRRIELTLRTTARRRAARAVPGARAARAAPAAAPEEWRHPLRFVWQMDAGRALHHRLRRIHRDHGTADRGADRAALAVHRIGDSISIPKARSRARSKRAAPGAACSVHWPVDGSEQRLAVELSGLPVFDRERTFRGYRGFGVCRDVAGLNAIAQARRAARPATPSTVETPSAVLPPEVDAPGLTPGRALRVLRTLAPAHEPHQRSGCAGRAAPPTPTRRAAAHDVAGSRRRPRAAPTTKPHHREDARPFLDRLPIGVLIYRLEPSALCQQGLPELGRQRQPGSAGGGRRPRQPDDRVRRHRHRGGRPQTVLDRQPAATRRTSSKRGCCRCRGTASRPSRC